MNTVDEMKSRYGDEETETYIRLTKAIGSLVAEFGRYQEAEDGSNEELLSKMKLDLSMEALMRQPEHARFLIEGLIAMVASMRQGGKYETWFTELGLEVPS